MEALGLAGASRLAGAYLDQLREQAGRVSDQSPQ